MNNFKLVTMTIFSVLLYVNINTEISSMTQTSTVEATEQSESSSLLIPQYRVKHRSCYMPDGTKGSRISCYAGNGTCDKRKRECSANS